MMFFLLLACSDYNLNSEKPDPNPGEFDSSPPAGAPDLVVDPLDAEVFGHCESATVEVRLENVGDALLTVTGLELAGEGWSMAPVDLPLQIEPGSSVVVEVVGTDGDATLTVVSDDGDVEVSLSATPNRPPDVEIAAPTSGEVIDEGVDLKLIAVVSDDTDAPEDLVVIWTSDVDGTVGTATADSVGVAQLTWQAASRTAGAHDLSVRVVDSCGNAVSEELPICQQLITTTPSVDLASWNYEGDARWDSSNNWVELTDTGGYRVGSAFDITTKTVGDAVTIEFQFWMGGGSGADGFALTALDLDRATAYLGSAGGCLGYGYDGGGCGEIKPALPGWTVEVDTYLNGGWDPTADDHLAFMFDGDIWGVEAWSALPEMEDSAWHTMVVEVADPHVTVSIDGTTYIDQDLSGYFGFPAHVGFSAATGGSTNYHLIDALTVTEAACDVE